MPLSLRKPPKFQRKNYHRLGQRHPWDDDNEDLVDVGDGEISHETLLELSQPMTRNRLRGERTQKAEDSQLAGTHKKLAEEYLTYELQPNDTIQGIALKYGCSVSELKRTNNLMKDKEAFALKTIRIPAREHSVLFEIFSQPNSSCPENRESKTFHVSISQMLQKNSQQEPSLFLQEMDRDIQRMVVQAEAHQSCDLEKQVALSTPRFEPLVKPYYDGANWGINWYWLLIVLLVISVLAPLSYGIYFVTMNHNYNVKTLNNTTSKS